MTEWSVSHAMKKNTSTQKKVIGLLLVELVSTKKHIVAKDVVGLLLGKVFSKYDKKYTSWQRMWLAYQ